MSEATGMHATTILAVRRDGKTAIAGDGQVTVGDTVMKHNAKKVHKMYNDRVLAGFAGASADAFTLFEKFEAKLEQYHGNLTRAAVELAKDWRTDRVLRRLEALMIVADSERSFILSGTGGVVGLAGSSSVDYLRMLKSSLTYVRQAAETNKTKLDSAKSGNVPDASDMGNTKIGEGLSKLRSMVETTMAELSGTAFPQVGSGVQPGEISMMENTFAFPSLFANEDLISVDTSDELYNKLLGAQKLFTELSKDANVQDLPVTDKGIAEGNMAVAIKNRQAYAKFLKFLFALNKIFPVDGKATGTMWEERAVKSERYESVRTWEEKSVLRRERLHSLGNFLTANRLKLGKRPSDPPTPMYFYVLETEAKPVEYENPDGKKLSWEDTIFSRVVDEFKLSGGRIVEDELGPNAISKDDEIVKLRKSVRDPYLTTKVRQELIIAYARRHFGSRGHDRT